MSIKKNLLRSGAALTTRFSADRRHLSERLTGIMDARRKSKAIPLVAAILLCSLLSGLVVSCRPGEQKPGETDLPESTLPVTDPTGTDPSGSETAEPSPLTEQEIEALYTDAVSLWHLFYVSSEGEGPETMLKNYMVYNIDTKFGSTDALRAALTESFSDELTETLLADQRYTEHEGKLWVLSSARGTDIRCGNGVRYVITSATADRVEVDRIVPVEDIISPDGETYERVQVGSSTQKLSLIRRGENWVFDTFTVSDDLSDYDSRYPVDYHPTRFTIDTLLASLTEEQKSKIEGEDGSMEAYITVLDRLLHPDAHRAELDEETYALYSSMQVTDHYFYYEDGNDGAVPLRLWVYLSGTAPIGMHPGWNHLSVYNSILYGPDMYTINFVPDYPSHSDAETALREYLNQTACYEPPIGMANDDFPSNEESSMRMLIGEYLISRILRSGDDSVSLAELQSRARQVFGINDFQPAGQNYDPDRDNCYIAGHGGTSISYRVRDCYEKDGVYTLNVTFFADFGCQIPSHVISYRLRPNGAFWDFLSYEYLMTADRAPAVFSM